LFPALDSPARSIDGAFCASATDDANDLAVVLFEVMFWMLSAEKKSGREFRTISPRFRISAPARTGKTRDVPSPLADKFIRVSRVELELPFNAR